MAAVAKLEPMFLNPIDAALHASIELEKIGSDRLPNYVRLEAILEALTNQSLRASGAIYGMTSLASHDAYSHICRIDEALDEVSELFNSCQRDVRRIAKDTANRLKENCVKIHDHYQAAKWIEERSGFSR